VATSHCPRARTATASGVNPDLTSGSPRELMTDVTDCRLTGPTLRVPGALTRMVIGVQVDLTWTPIWTENVVRRPVRRGRV
jgi:hypothetical protein